MCLPRNTLFLHLAHVQNFNDDIDVALLLVYLLLGGFLLQNISREGREDGRVVVYLYMCGSGGLLWVYIRSEMEITKNKNP